MTKIANKDKAVYSILQIKSHFVVNQRININLY